MHTAPSWWPWHAEKVDFTTSPHAVAIPDATIGALVLGLEVNINVDFSGFKSIHSKITVQKLQNQIAQGLIVL